MENQKPIQIKIPDKLYFKIGEVSKICGLPSYVLRFWETQFKKINPRRTDSGQRAYTPKDITMILEIKQLLYEKRLTIEGTRNYLNARAKTAQTPTKQFLEEIKTELVNIRDLLD